MTKVHSGQEASIPGGDVLTLIAQLIGFSVIAAAALVALFALGVVAWRYWPISGLRTSASALTAGGRFVPRIDWRNNMGMFNQINLLVGLTSRNKARWFFGFMLFTPTEYDRELAVPKIIHHQPFPDTAGNEGEAEVTKTPTPQRAA